MAAERDAAEPLQQKQPFSRMPAVGSSGGLGPPCPFVLCDKFSDGRDQLAGNFHDCLSRILICGLVIGNGLLFRLLFVVLEYSLHFFFVPTWREFTLFHLLPFLRKRLRYANNGFPRNSYAVITNTLSGSESVT